MDVAIQIEGQSGLDWAAWRRIGPAVEDLGFAALFRSDHFVNPEGREDSLEAWTSLTWLADHTSRIEFGPLVSPVSFRDPVMLARTASAVAELSDGRLVLGVGTGWSAREHAMFGYDLLDVTGRIDRYIEALDIVSGLLRGDGPMSYDGTYYRLRDAELRPRLDASLRPRLLLPARGTRRMLPIAAERADVWNVMFVDAATFAELNRTLDALLDRAGRARESVQRTVMVGVDVGRTREEVDRKLESRAWAAAWRDPGLVSGTPDEIEQQLASWAHAGADRVILQWLDYDDMEGLELLAGVF